MSDLAELITQAVAGKTALKAETLEGDTVALHFTDGTVLTLFGNGRKTVRQETELCGACSMTPSSMSTPHVSKGEVLAQLHEKLGPPGAPASPPPAAASKPPPIKLGVQGVASALVFGCTDSGATSQYDWHKLVNHPPFQMYVNAMQGVVPGDQVQIAKDFVLRQGKDLTEEQAFSDYATWFDAQGRWPREDALGNPLEA